MRSIETEEKAVTIRLTGEPTPSRAELMWLVRLALEARGFPAWEDTEAECFTAGEEILVIARPGERRRAFFFDDMDALLTAVSGSIGDGAVYAVPEGYVLIPAPGKAPPILREFGREMRLPPLWEVFARERGWRIVPEGGTSVLANAFRQE